MNYLKALKIIVLAAIIFSFGGIFLNNTASAQQADQCFVAYYGPQDEFILNCYAIDDQFSCEEVFNNCSQPTAACDPYEPETHSWCLSRAEATAIHNDLIGGTTPPIDPPDADPDGDDPSPNNGPGSGSDIEPPVYESSLIVCGRTNLPEDQCTFNHFIQVANNLIDTLIQLSLAIGTVVLVILGFQYLLAGSVGKKVEAKDNLVRLAKGFAFILLAWLIVNTIFIIAGVEEGYNYLQEEF